MDSTLLLIASGVLLPLLLAIAATPPGHAASRFWLSAWSGYRFTLALVLMGYAAASFLLLFIFGAGALLPLFIYAGAAIHVSDLPDHTAPPGRPR